MFRDLMAASPMLCLPLTSLFLFLGIFAAVLVAAYGRKASAYAKVESLPLAEDEGKERAS